jgi:hypothetical protein
MAAALQQQQQQQHVTYTRSHNNYRIHHGASVPSTAFVLKKHLSTLPFIYFLFVLLSF